MLYVFGDSHANYNMKNCTIQHINLYENSITMYRIGRDNTIINFDSSFNNKDNTFLFFYGEVDCRCHIGQQVMKGRYIDEIVEELVGNYFRTISNNIKDYKKIIIGSITPPMYRHKFEDKYGPITHEFPFVGTDEERAIYTKLVNNKLREYCKKYNYIFLDLADNYSDEFGLFIYEKSDGICHIIDNSYIHNHLSLALFQD